MFKTITAILLSLALSSPSIPLHSQQAAWDVYCDSCGSSVNELRDDEQMIIQHDTGLALCDLCYDYHGGFAAYTAKYYPETL